MAECLGETQSTLAFARRCMSVVNKGVVVNEAVTASAAELAAEVARLRRELAMLRSLREPGGSPGDACAGDARLSDALEVNAALEAKAEALEAALHLMRRERDSLDQELGAAAVVAAEGETAARTRADEAAAELVALRAKQADTEAFLLAMQGELKGLAAERDALSAALAEKSAALTDTEAAAQRLEGELGVAHAQLAAAVAERERRSLPATDPGLTEQISALEATAAALNKRHQQLLQRNNEVAAERDALRSRVQELECRASNAETVMAVGKEQVAALRAERQAQADESARLAERLACAEAERAELARRVGELGTEVENRRLSREVSERKEEASKCWP